jgi:hypothetical protein
MTASFILIKGGCKRPASIAPIQEARGEDAFVTGPPNTRFPGTYCGAIHLYSNLLAPPGCL